MSALFENVCGVELDNLFFHPLTWLEARNATCLDVNLSARLRVTARTCLTFGHVERAEVRQRDLTVLLQALRYMFRDRIKNLLR